MPVLVPASLFKNGYEVYGISLSSREIKRKVLSPGKNERGGLGKPVSLVFAELFLDLGRLLCEGMHYTLDGSVSMER